jgi:hypothetical protein
MQISISKKRVIEVVGKRNRLKKVWYPPKLDRIVRLWLGEQRVISPRRTATTFSFRPPARNFRRTISGGLCEMRLKKQGSRK